MKTLQILVVTLVIIYSRVRLSNCDFDDVLAEYQLERYKETHSVPSDATDQRGVPMPSLVATLGIGIHGPLLLQDTFFIDHLAHFDRERIAERVVHAKGAGAFGTFTVLNPHISQYTKADFLQPGKVTPIFARFTTTVGSLGSADTTTDPRGFAVKFYTHEGNYDFVGNNIVVFPIRDPMLFPSLIHSQKKNPETNLADANSFWDFVTLRQENVLHTLFKFSGVPDGHRYMNGYGVHAFKMVNAGNSAFFVKLYFVTNQGQRYLSYANATKIAGEDPDYSTRDLYNAIATGDFPSWDLFIQVIPASEVYGKDYESDESGYNFKDHLFDPTKFWKFEDVPPIFVGRMVLNKNPTNFFDEVEQVAFCPGNFVPGIEASPDRLLAGRMFSYPDTQRYRLGTNFPQMRINAPIVPVHSYQRDGAADFQKSKGVPNYFPNSYGGPHPNHHGFTSPFFVEGDLVGRFDTGDEDNYVLATYYWRKLSQDQKQILACNAASSLKSAYPDLQQRALAMYKKVDYSLSDKIFACLTNPTLLLEWNQMSFLLTSKIIL